MSNKLKSPYRRAIVPVTAVALIAMAGYLSSSEESPKDASVAINATEISPPPRTPFVLSNNQYLERVLMGEPEWGDNTVSYGLSFGAEFSALQTVSCSNTITLIDTVGSGIDVPYEFDTTHPICTDDGLLSPDDWPEMLTSFGIVEPR